jgi:hypothetical protein
MFFQMMARAAHRRAVIAGAGLSAQSKAAKTGQNRQIRVLQWYRFGDYS